MLQASCKKHVLEFNFPAGTSRGVLHTKDVWYIYLHDTITNFTAIGECSTIPNLSIDYSDSYSAALRQFCDDINDGKSIDQLDLTAYPSIRFGFEMALLNLKQQQEGILYPSSFTKENDGIPINGLIWMGTFEQMDKQIKEKLQQGFKCIKIKIGAIDFESEISLIKQIRDKYPVDEITIRVDANGAFDPREALNYMDALAKYNIHSIEQPIKQGQIKQMKDLCIKTPLPIALDEELIGIHGVETKRELIEFVKPQYIILKPSLLGGFTASQEWIKIANEFSVDWWITSALESNVGLNAIAQWTYQLNKPGYHGLGTGKIYKNNIKSPLYIEKESLYYNHKASWGSI
jgi:o-succinylbenzoate synthase